MTLRALAVVLLMSGCGTTTPPATPTHMFAAGDAYDTGAFTLKAEANCVKGTVAKH